MAVFSGGKSVGENAGEVFRRDADAVVGDFNPDLVLRAPAYPRGHEAIFFAALGAGAFGVLKQVDQNLEDFVAVHDDGGAASN